MEEWEDVEKRTLISERGGLCVAVGFVCVAVQLSGGGFFTNHNIYTCAYVYYQNAALYRQLIVGPGITRVNQS